MFVPTKMSQVDIFVFEEDVQQVAQVVAKLGIMHLLDVNALGKWAQDVDTEWAGRSNTYDRQEQRISELLTELRVEERPYPCQGGLDPAKDVTSVEKQLQEAEERIHTLRDRQSAIERELQHRELVARSMARLSPLSISIPNLRELEHLHLVIGTIPSENLARLEASLFRIPYSIVPVHRFNHQVLVFAFCATEHAPILDRALESALLDPLTLPEEFGGSAKEVLEQIHQDQEQAHDELETLQTQRKGLAKELGPELLALRTQVQRDATIADAMSHFGHRGRVYLMAGWVPADRVEELREAVENAAQGRATFEENPLPKGEQADVPTLLRHSRLLRPIEGLVATYGIPGYREIDPTLLVGFTFVLMFGAMFGDLGHGLVLALLGAIPVLGILPQLSGLASAGTILIACGLSSSLFGLLYGSFFGMEDVIPSLWLRPMEDIPTLLGASIVLGFIILNIGFICRLASALRSSKLKEAVFDKNGLTGLLLYWSLIATVLLIATGHTVPALLWAAMVVLVLALFMSEPLTRLIQKKRPLMEGSPAEAGVQAFFELFEALIGYVSNTLSYVRLGAFAVAHAGLSMVVFLLADMVSGGGRWSPARLLVIVFGNLAIIGFEGLIVGIQTLRLEYYELFGKFFRGEGTRFRPLTLPATECELPNGAERSST